MEAEKGRRPPNALVGCRRGIARVEMLNVVRDRQPIGQGAITVLGIVASVFPSDEGML
jgi:hypothetical protein